MNLNTTEHIKAFIRDVAQVAHALNVNISVNLDSAIYGGVNFEVTPSGFDGLSPPPNEVTQNNGVA